MGWWEHTEQGLTTSGVVAWVAERLEQVPADRLPTGLPVVEGPKMPETLHRVCVITRSGGVGLQYEGAFDAQVFQVRTRGASARPSVSDPSEAERLAWLVDGALLSASMPTMGGVPTLGWNRSGGPPTPEEDAGNRTVMLCNYVIIAASVLSG